MKRVIMALIVCLILAACTAQTAAVETMPAPTETATPSPTSTLAPTLTPTPTATPAPLFTNVQNLPIVYRPLEGKFIDPGAVIYHEGQFHMFYNEFASWPAPVDVYYVTSADGVEWERPQTDPILRSEDVPYAGLAALASSLVVEDDGTWVLYFYTWSSSRTPVSEGAIGRATAPDPLGPWAVDPDPVLEPGETGAWDSTQVRAPDVLRTDEGYRMYYGGFGSSGSMGVGLATSDDGISWAKHAQPVLVPAEGDAWDSESVFQPNVVFNGEQYVMLYRSQVGRGKFQHGLAFSPDGLSWERHTRNPIFPERGDQTWFTALIYEPDTYYLFYEKFAGAPPDGRTNIHLATFEGSLP